MVVRGSALKSNPTRKSFEPTFHAWFSSGSVPSWKLLNDGPSERLREYPSLMENFESGNSVSPASYMRRRTNIECGDDVTGMFGFDVDGFSGFTSRS